jgi:hypothetical protein
MEATKCCNAFCWGLWNGHFSHEQIQPGVFPARSTEVGKAAGQSGAPAGSRRSRALDVKEKHLRRSIAIAVYNQEAVVPELLRRTTAGLDSLPGGTHETVLADDGSFGP